MTALKDLCNKELPRTPELQAELQAVKNALGLLNSMVESGERHSDQSRKAVKRAFEILPKH